MKAHISKTIIFFKSQLHTTLESEFHSWPEFDHFQGRLWALEKETSKVQPAHSISQLMTAAKTVKQILHKSPLQPRMVDLLLEVASFDSDFLEQSNLSVTVKQLTESASQLVESNNPMSDAAIKFVSRARDGQNSSEMVSSSTVLIVDRRAKDFVQDIWLQEYGLDAVAHSAQEARVLPPFGVSVIFGSPKWHIRGWKTDENTGSHPSSWLINTPTGCSQLVLLTEGSPTFKSREFAPWSESQVPKSSCVPKNISPVRSDIIPEWTPTPPPANRSDSDQMAGLVEARPILLPDGYWIYFATSQAGPKPGVVVLGDDGVSYEYSEVNRLNRGQILLIRSASASREYLRQQAEEYLDRKHGNGCSTEYFTSLDDFKHAVQNFGKSEFYPAQKLQNRGFSPSEARRRLNDAWDETVIAPDSRDVYEKLCDAVGFQPGRNSWLHLTRIRTAMRQAGLMARRELLQVLKNDLSWPEPVSLGDIYVVRSDDLGEMHIAKIEEVSNSIQEIHLTRLGRLVNPDGTMYEGDE